jgi:hypothetical protein
MVREGQDKLTVTAFPCCVQNFQKRRKKGSSVNSSHSDLPIIVKITALYYTYTGHNLRILKPRTPEENDM